MMEAITGIPPKAVGRVVQDFIDDGATNLLVEMNEDGTFTVSRSAEEEPALEAAPQS